MSAPSSRYATFALVLSACAAFGAGATAAEPGVTEDAVIFGQSACFTGACAGAGTRYRAGILAAFQEVNDTGGVNGREIGLVSRDDAYEPERAASNANWFVSSNEVFAVIGGVGTPTAKRIAPTLRRANVPFVGHLTGGDFLGDGDRYPNVVNVRTQYDEETHRLVAHMFEEMGARRFGIIYQEDALGRSLLASFESALKSVNLSILAKASYSRHTHAVHASVFIMGKADLDAVFLATVTGPAADAINTSRALGHGYAVGLLSFIDLTRLAPLLDYPNERIVLTRVTPDIADDSVAVVHRFHRALAAWNTAEPKAAAHVADSNALEGYLLGRFIIEVLRRMPGELTREAFLATALGLEPFVIDDWVITFEAGSNVGSHYVRLIEMSGDGSTKETAE